MPFDDWEEKIEKVLDDCDVVLAVIGPSWTANPRLQEEDDMLRREIRRALERGDVKVFAVLVQGARIPTSAELPPDLRELLRYEAIELSDKRWDMDLAELVEALRRVFPEPEREQQEPPPPPPPPRMGLVAVAMTVAAGAGVLLASLFNGGFANRRAVGAPTGDRVLYFAAERGVTGAFVGALLLAAVALMLRRDRSAAVGYALAGLGAGVVGGAIGGASYMLLKDNDIVASEELLRAVAAAGLGVALGAVVARVVAGQISICMLAGLGAGLLGGILAEAIIGQTGQTVGVGKVLFEAVLVAGAIAAVATTSPPSVPGRPGPGAHA